MSEMVSRVLVQFPPFLFALCFHEYAHGWVARRKGDRTAEIMGRLTLNPAAHADQIGTIILPILSFALGTNFFFGWAKPVPVNDRNLKDPRRDMFWIALAGPVSNLLLALISTFILVFIERFGGGGQIRFFIEFFKTFLLINLFLAVFNMIPLHPLDGGKVLARFLPARVNEALESNHQATTMMLIVLMVSGAMAFLAIPVRMVAETLFFFAYSIAGLIT